jgi:carboxylate-amine ligase
MRYGHDAELMDREFASATGLGELVDREAERLGIDGIVDLHDAESGAERQRRLRDERGVDALCDSLRLQYE